MGFEVVRFLSKMKAEKKIVAGVRNTEKAKGVFKDYPDMGFVHFDFEDPDTFKNALTGIDRVFLLRPPHISNVERNFRPLISQLRKLGIGEVLFLSVQGAEKSKVIPHNKIERLIMEYDLDYTFLRPSYFMQNLTTTFLNDIKTKREIILPAGKAKFNWIDIGNIGEAAAILLNEFENYKNQAFEITGPENENFETVTDIITQVTGISIKYRNTSPFAFYKMKRKERMRKGMIMVLIMLHFLPRFQKEPRISHFYEQLTGKNPTDLQSFIERERRRFA